MNKPKKWKFNKARQNWIVRNIWSPEAVRYFTKFPGHRKLKWDSIPATRYLFPFGFEILVEDPRRISRSE